MDLQLYYFVNTINQRPIRSVFLTFDEYFDIYIYRMNWLEPFTLLSSEDAHDYCDFSKWHPSFNERWK